MTQSTKKPTEKEMHNSVRKTLHSYHIFDRNEIDRYNKISRFGFYDPYNTLSVTREYIFITKPDLHIFEPLDEYFYSPTDSFTKLKITSASRFS